MNLLHGRWYPATIQTMTDSKDTEGGPVEIPTNTGTGWVRITPLSGSERFQVQYADVGVTHRLDLRWQDVSGLTPKDQIVSRDRTFKIKSLVNVAEGNASAELLCEEVF